METFSHLHIHGQETMNYRVSEVFAHIGKSSQLFDCAGVLSAKPPVCEASCKEGTGGKWRPSVICAFMVRRP